MMTTVIMIFIAFVIWLMCIVLHLLAQKVPIPTIRCDVTPPGSVVIPSLLSASVRCRWAVLTLVLTLVTSCGVGRVAIMVLWGPRPLSLSEFVWVMVLLELDTVLSHLVTLFTYC